VQGSPRTLPAHASSTVWRLTSTQYDKSLEKPSGHFSRVSPRCGEPFPVSPMRPSSPPSDKEYVTRRCSRSWQHTTSRVLLRFTAWPTNVPEPLRAVHGTRPFRMGLPNPVALESPPRAAPRRRRRIVAARSHCRELRSQQHPLGVGIPRPSAQGSKGETARACALSTPMPTTALPTAARSKSSRSASASARRPGKHLPHSDLSTRGRLSTTGRPLPLEKGIWGTNPQIGP